MNLYDVAKCMKKKLEWTVFIDDVAQESVIIKLAHLKNINYMI